MDRQFSQMSRIIVLEERYLALKDLPKFQSKSEGSPITGRRYLSRLIYLGYDVSVSAMIAFSALLSVTQLRLPYPLAHIQTLSIVLYSYIFLVSLYSSIMYVNTLSNYHLIEPIRALPTNMGRQAIPFSWLVFTGSSSIFVIIPPLVAYVWYTGNLWAVPAGIIWAFIILALGYTAGIAAAYVMSGNRSGRKIFYSGTLSYVLKILAMISVFVLFEVAIQIPQEIPLLPLAIGHPFYIALPMVGIAYTVFETGQPQIFMFYELASSFGYLILAIVTFIFVNRKVVEKVATSDLTQTSAASVRETKMHRFEDRFYGALFWKDVRGIVRKPQNVLMFLIPAFLVLPTLVSVFFFTPGLGLISVYNYMILLIVVVLSSAFYSLLLMVFEGNEINLLRLLPLGDKELIFSKGFVGAFIFVFVLVPISILFFLHVHPGIITLIFVPLNLMSAFLGTSFYNIRRLVVRIPPRSTTLNLYTFGGNAGLALLFLITAVLVGIPATASAAFSFFMSSRGISNAISFFPTSLFLNVLFLFIVLRMVHRTARLP